MGRDRVWCVYLGSRVVLRPWQFELEIAIHNFVRPDRGLKYNIPMMAAGKTDHVWAVEELLLFSV